MHEKYRIEHHRCGAACLAAHAIHVQLERQCTHIANLVGRRDPWPRGRKGVTRLALRPLSAALHLKLALGHIVHDAVPGDVRLRIEHRIEIARIGTDHDAQLHLVIRLDRPARNEHVVIRAHDGVGALQEDDRFAWHLGADFRRMVGVIQADAHELSRTRHARGPARALRNIGESDRRSQQHAQRLHATVAEECWCPVRKMCTTILSLAVDDHRRSLGADRAPSCEFHVAGAGRMRRVAVPRMRSPMTHGESTATAQAGKDGVRCHERQRRGLAHRASGWMFLPAARLPCARA